MTAEQEILFSSAVACACADATGPKNPVISKPNRTAPPGNKAAPNALFRVSSKLTDCCIPVLLRARYSRLNLIGVSALVAAGVGGRGDVKIALARLHASVHVAIAA